MGGLIHGGSRRFPRAQSPRGNQPRENLPRRLGGHGTGPPKPIHAFSPGRCLPTSRVRTPIPRDCASDRHHRSTSCPAVCSISIQGSSPPFQHRALPFVLPVQVPFLPEMPRHHDLPNNDGEGELLPLRWRGFDNPKKSLWDNGFPGLISPLHPKWPLK